MKEMNIEGFQLSPQQRHLWMIQRGDQIPYKVQCKIVIDGELNVGVLNKALDIVIQRHELLRTIFRRLPGMAVPIQIINENTRSLLNKHDLSELDNREQDIMIKKISRDASHLTYDFENGPLLHLSLVIMSPSKHILIITVPTICADTAGIRNLVNEISRSYQASLEGKELSDEPMQYVDFATWQNELLEAEDTEAGREYWRRHYSSSLFSQKLPFEVQPSVNQVFDLQSITENVPPGILTKIRELARENNVSMSSFLLSCWQVLLYRLTGQEKVIIGSYFDGRNYEKLQTALGLFGRYLPFDCSLHENMEFTEILKQGKKTETEMSQWQEYYSLELIINVKDDINIGTPYIPFGFDYTEQPEKQSLPALSFSIFEQYSCIDRFKVKLSCMLSDTSLITEFWYDANLFRIDDIRRLARHYQVLLDSIVNRPHSAISECRIISDDERQQLLVDFNNTQKGYPQDGCIHRMFEKRAERVPDNIAVVFEDQTLTYAELNTRANQLAHYLQDLGVGPDMPVALCVERSLEMVVGLLSILKAGGAYIPLDPSLPKGRLAFMMDDTRAQVVVTQEHFAEELSQFGKRVLSLDRSWGSISSKSKMNPFSSVNAGNLVYVLFTSGSTGKPKGVAVEHRQLDNYVRAIIEKLDLPAEASFAMVSTFAADLCNTAIFPPLLSGGCLHVVSHQRALDPHALSDYFQRNRIDCLKITPSHLEALLSSPSTSNILPKSRLVLGGEACRWELLDRVHELSPACAVFNHYGPTEATVGVAAYRVYNDRSSRLSATSPIGRPLANTRIYLLDSHGQPVPVWVSGELYIGGACLARGYYNRPELTKERFIANPFSDQPDSRLYRTGDLARYLPDGNIEFLGRVDNQVKIRGFRTELGEIDVALRKHPNVREAVTIMREDVTGDKRLVAYLVYQKGSDVPDNEIRSFLKNSLPEYMIPSAIVKLDSIPLNPNGKLDQQTLPAPEQTAPGSAEGSFVEPRTQLESAIAEIWQEVLEVNRVGVYDNFFDLGGHSLLSLQVVAKLEKKIGLRINPGEMIFQTLGQLASACEERINSGEMIDNSK